LIEAHTAAYAAFGKAVHEMGGNRRDYNRAGREEERALLAVCAYQRSGKAIAWPRPDIF
jgi:hypothetical protein